MFGLLRAPYRAIAWVEASDNAALGALVVEKIAPIPGIRKTLTYPAAVTVPFEGLV